MWRPLSIHAYVLGEHGDSSVVHWSNALIAGMPVLEFAVQRGRPIDAALQQQMEHDVRTAAYRIKAGKGVSNFGDWWLHCAPGQSDGRR